MVLKQMRDGEEVSANEIKNLKRFTNKFRDFNDYQEGDVFQLSLKTGKKEVKCEEITIAF